MTPAASARPRGRIGLLTLVGLFTAAGPLGTDTYLPALPQVATDLDTTAALTANTLTIYLIGLGVGQLVWGPISDRVGRRRPILVGLLSFAAASLVCAIAPNIWVLLTARLVMGLAGSSMVVLGRSIVRDLYTGDELTRIFGRLQIAFGIAPVVGPLLGGAMLLFTDWRGTFVMLAVLSAGLFVASLPVVHETLPRSRRIHGGSQARREAWRAPFRTGPFLLNASILLGATVSMLCYITFVSFVLQRERGVSAGVFSLMFGGAAIMVVTGGQLGPLLTRRFGAQPVLRVAIAVNLLAAVGVALSALLGWPTWLLYLFLIVTVLQASICQPLAIAQALIPFPSGAGTAASIAGAAQMGIGSLIPGIIAQLFGESGVVLGTAQAATSVITLAVATIGGMALARRRGASGPDRRG